MPIIVRPFYLLLQVNRNQMTHLPQTKAHPKMKMKREKMYRKRPKLKHLLKKQLKKNQALQKTVAQMKKHLSTLNQNNLMRS